MEVRIRKAVLIQHYAKYQRPLTRMALIQIYSGLEISLCQAVLPVINAGRKTAVNDFLELAGDYDGFIFGTPVHWGGASGAITSFLDRAFYADLNGGGKRFYLKPAAAVISARRAGTTAAWDQMNKYFGLMQMPIITSRYWNMVHGTTPEEVREDREGIQTMEILGHNMAYFLKCRDIGSKLLPLPPQMSVVYTNFIR